MLRPSPIPIPDETEELAKTRALTPEERARILSMVVRTSARLLDMSPNRERILAYRDPLPPSSVAHWARLRELARKRQGQGQG